MMYIGREGEKGPMKETEEWPSEAGGEPERMVTCKLKEESVRWQWRLLENERSLRARTVHDHFLYL